MKHKINIVDVFIMLAVFFAFVGVGARIYIAATVESANISDYTVTIVAKGISSDNNNAVKTGDTVTRKDDGLVLGTVEYVSYTEHKTYAVNQDNLYTEVTDSSKLDLTVKIKVKGEMTEDGFMHNGTTYLSAGMNLTFSTENFQGKAVIMDISNEK